MTLLSYLIFDSVCSKLSLADIHTWNCQIRTHIHTEIYTQTLFFKKKKMFLIAFITGNRILEPLRESLLAQFHIDLS